MVEVQKELGAPHDLMHQSEAKTRTIGYGYHLTSGNIFLIAYEHGGVIVKAWVIDEAGEVQSVLIDRTDIYGTVDVE